MQTDAPSETQQPATKRPLLLLRPGLTALALLLAAACSPRMGGSDPDPEFGPQAGAGSPPTSLDASVTPPPTTAGTGGNPNPNPPPGTAGTGGNPNPNPPPGTAGTGGNPNPPPGTAGTGGNPTPPPGTAGTGGNPNPPPGTAGSGGNPNPPPGTAGTGGNPNQPPKMDGGAPPPSGSTTINVPTSHSFNTGGSVDIPVDSPVAGSAIVNFSYLADHLRGDMSCTLTANGSSGTITFSHTDHSFGMAAQSKTATVPLNQGRNTLRLTCPQGGVSLKGGKVVVSGGGGSTPGEPPPAGSVNPCPDAEPILAGAKCSGCHSGANAMFIDLTSADLKSRVLNKPSQWGACNGKVLVDSTGAGVLVDSLTGGGCVSLMPKGGAKLSDADINCVKQWAAWIAGN